MWVIPAGSDSPIPFQLDGDINSPVVVGGNGVAYVTTARSDLDAPEPVMVWRVDPSLETSTVTRIVGQSAGSVVVAPDGTAYQLVTREDPGDPRSARYVLAAISPGTTVADEYDLGTFSRLYPQNSTTVAPDGTVYQVLGHFDFATYNGDATVFRLNGTTVRAIPLDGVASTPVAIDASGKAYDVTAANVDRQTLEADKTLWVIDSSGSAAPVEIPINTEGIPVSLSIAGDSAFFTTLRYDNSDPNALKQVYEFVVVPIPSQAV
jgi:hypothetical protein